MARLRLLEVDLARVGGRPTVSLSYDPSALGESLVQGLPARLFAETACLAEAVVAEPPLVLFGLPFAGATAQVLDVFAAHLPGRVTLCPLALPGREAHSTEAPQRTIADLVAAARAALPVRGARFALFGHSLGALLAYELARELARQGEPGPVHLFVSGLGAPWRIPPRTVTAAELSGEAGGDEWRRTLLEADLAAVEGYRYAEGPRLLCPITVLCGDEEGISETDATAWGKSRPPS